MADPAPANNSKPWSYYAFGLGAIAVGVLALAVLVAFLANGKVTDSKDVIALVGGVASPIVSMVSAYFGITAAAKSQTESAANQKNTSDQAIQSISQTKDLALQAVTTANANAFVTALYADPANTEAILRNLVSATQAFTQAGPTTPSPAPGQGSSEAEPNAG